MDEIIRQGQKCFPESKLKLYQKKKMRDSLLKLVNAQELTHKIDDFEH